MPKPPPRSSSGSSTPRASRICDCSASTRRADTSKPLASKICEPMCECRPRSSSTSSSRILNAAAAAAPAGEREAELLVLVRGGDELVGVRLHADGDPDQHLRAYPALAGQLGEPVDLGERVDDDPAHPGVDRPGQLGDRLVVAVEADPLRRHPGRQRDGQLTAGADVEEQALLGDHPDHRAAQERLAGVVDVRVREGRAELAAALAQVVLVQHVRRGAVLGGQVADVQARDGQRAGRAARHVARPQLRHQGVDVDRGTQPGRPPAADLAVQRSCLDAPACSYIRSGADTPSRRRPLAMTTRVASLSQSRARWVSVIFSSPCGAIRQLS